MRTGAPDAVVVGSGPNGLAAALGACPGGLVDRGVRGGDDAGGGCRTEELTLPGFRHDVCSTVQSLVSLSPFLAGLDLERLGVRLCIPEVAFAHPWMGNGPLACHGPVDTTAAALGADGALYGTHLPPACRQRRLDRSDSARTFTLAPPPPGADGAFRTGRPALDRPPGQAISTEEAKALLAGVGAHAMLPLEAPLDCRVRYLPHHRRSRGRLAARARGKRQARRGRLGGAHRARSQAAHREMDRRLGELPPARAVVRYFHRDAARNGRGTLPRRYRAGRQRISPRPRHLQDRLGVLGPGAVELVMPAGRYGARRGQLCRGRQQRGGRRRRSPF